eukprot:CAMPEP_0119057076 /NCGR_PEP_ID=MMETSP1178-20130426/1606_1 /TAXON_ID=33656 /ORGANISM="unid sp, Strain CCMP2000" /LENGTH=157 /DNA_ID=CAMNT_0007037873 /DNA_START=251 /DNA_END=721 /DNA_ORIENTATION=+
MKRMKRSHSSSPRITMTPLTMRGLPLMKFAVTSVVVTVPSESFRYMPVVSPSSALAAARKEGLSNVNVATPVEPSRDLVSFTSGTHGSGTPMMNSMCAAGASASWASSAACRGRALACIWCAAPPREKAFTCLEASSSTRGRALTILGILNLVLAEK